MRRVSIPVLNNKKIELFVEKHQDRFEFWAVGIAKGQRMVIDHHWTHNDLETRLEYAKPEDLIWRDADRSEIPAEKHKHAISMEETMTRGCFWDSVDDQLRPYAFLDRDRKATSAAERLMFGQWTDGVLTFSLGPLNRLRWRCADSKHWLASAQHRGKPPPNWWTFSSVWELHLMNNDYCCGTHVSVLHVDDNELHLTARGYQNRMAHVFQKDRQPNTALEPTPTAP